MDNLLATFLHKLKTNGDLGEQTNKQTNTINHYEGIPYNKLSNMSCNIKAAAEGKFIKKVNLFLSAYGNAGK